MANSAASNAGEHKIFSATYSSPQNEHFSISKNIQAPRDDGVESKTRYLNDLRKAVVATQAEVNKELTARMEEDKAREGSTTKSAADEEKEEENYGEENAEADE
jgi:hypothetical protein